MNTNKAIYWIALGALALGLNSEYQQGRFAALHRFAQNTDSVVCRISTRAGQTLALAKMLIDREELPLDNLLASADSEELARSRAEMVREQAQDEAEMVRDTVRESVRDRVRAQADMIRAQAEIRRAEIEQIRRQTTSQFRFARTVNRRVDVTCPRMRARIAVDAGSESATVTEDLDMADLD